MAVARVAAARSSAEKKVKEQASSYDVTLKTSQSDQPVWHLSVPVLERCSSFVSPRLLIFLLPPFEAQWQQFSTRETRAC